MIPRKHPIIETILKKEHSLFVLGPRGSGKTYYLSRLIDKFKSKRTINLLNSVEYRKYLNRPSLIYDEVTTAVEKSTKTSPLYLMIDEIQLIPTLMSEVHRAIDKYKGQVIFILTGSSARKLRKTDVDLLASRAISTQFFPFHSSEIDYLQQLDKIICFGTLPEIFTTDDKWLMREKLKTYVGTYLNEEIKKETEVKDLEGFSLFLEYAAAMNGQTANFSKISRAAGISPPTVKAYFQVLLDTLICIELPAWTHSIRERLVKSSKYYFFDNGVLNALTNEGFDLPKKSSFLYGKLFENLVINELIRQIYLREKTLKTYHYRTVNGAEVDLILQKNAFQTPVAIEIKASNNPDMSSLKGLINFQKEHPEAHCFVMCQTDVPYSKDNIQFVNFIEGMDDILSACEQ